MTPEAPTANIFRPGLAWNLGLSALWFANSWKWFILLVAILPGQVADLVPGGEKNTAWGMVFSLGAIWAIFGPSIFGNLSDRLGRRRPFIAISAALTVLALVWLAGANQFWMLIVGYMLLQVSDDVGQGAGSALIPQYVPEDARGRASSIMSVLQLLAQIAGAVTGVILGGMALFGLNGVQLIYGLIAIVNIVCAVVTLRTISAAPEPFHVQEGPKPKFVDQWVKPWKNRDFVWVWLTRFLMAFGFYLIQPYLRNFLYDVVAKPSFPTYNLFGIEYTMIEKNLSLFGMNVGGASQGALILGLSISLTGAFGSILASKKPDKVGRKILVIVGGFIMAGAVAPFAFATNFSLIWLLALIFGFGYGIYLSADWALAADVMPSSSELGKDMGLWQMSVSSVQIFSGTGGRVIDSLNAGTMGLGYTVAILSAGALFVLSAVLVRKVKGSR